MTGSKRTGDASLTFLGRGSGCINTAGEKVFPREVEEALKRHPAVQDSLVVGVDDAVFGQRVAAVVSLKEPVADPRRELPEFCAATLARHKLPRTLVCVETIRRGPNGKPDYAWARALLESAPGDA